MRFAVPSLLALASFAVLGAGCSLILATVDPSQCASNRDCDANPSFKNRVCQEGFCVVPKDPVTQVSNDAGAGCISTQACSQVNSNKAAVCKVAGGPCTLWQTEVCPIVTGPWQDPNVIVIGSILPLHVKQANGALLADDYARRVRLAIDLGQSELQTAFPQGIPFPGSPSRPIAVIHCDSNFDPARTQLAMTHLTDVVGAQAVIVGGDAELLAVQAQAAAKKTALVCSDCVGPFPPGNAAWRIVPPLAQEAGMAAWRVDDLETTIKSGPTPPAAIKVAVLTEPGAGAQAFVAALVSTLQFNGKSVDANGSNFTLETSENALVQPVIYTNHADKITAAQPDIIVVAMGGDFPAHYLDLIEAGWTGPRKPYYVLTGLLYDAALFVTPLSTKPDELRTRISGTRNGFEQALDANVASFTTRYKLANNFIAPDGNYSGYDAFYAMAYAIAASANQPTYDGPHVSAGFERLISGTTIDFGPNQLGLGVALLGQATGSVNVRGLWTDLDWDLTTHDLTLDSSMFCFEYDTDGALIVTPDAGPRYAHATGVVTGTYSCN